MDFQPVYIKSDQICQKSEDMQHPIQQNKDKQRKKKI